MVAFSCANSTRVASVKKDGDFVGAGIFVAVDKEYTVWFNGSRATELLARLFHGDLPVTAKVAVFGNLRIPILCNSNSA